MARQHNTTLVLDVTTRHPECAHNRLALNIQRGITRTCSSVTQRCQPMRKSLDMRHSWRRRTRLARKSPYPSHPGLTHHTQALPITPKPYPSHPSLTHHTQALPITPRPYPSHPGLTHHTQALPITPRPYPSHPSLT